MKTKLALGGLALLATLNLASAQIYITEFFYQGRGSSGTLGFEHEFVELTNFGASAVDVTGWYYRDSTEGNPTATPNSPFSLSGFGSIAAGESVIITDLSEADFRLVWGTLDPSVRVIGLSAPGLGRSDAIRIFDANDDIVDQLRYGDETFAGSERFRYTTGVTDFANLGADNIVGWFFSDTDGTTNLTSANGDVGNPGYVNTTAIPEPATAAALVGLLALAGALSRRAKRDRSAA